MPLWRVFPWNPHATDGAPFSARYAPPTDSHAGGRFDLGTTPVLYLAQSPAHAVAEVLQGYRGKKLAPQHLVRGDPDQPGTYHPLALAQTWLPANVEARLPDLTDPAVLVRLGIRPDVLASHDRAVTQATARRIHAAGEGYPGLRWWSALTGEWHAVVLFLDRVAPAAIDYAEPEPIDV